MAAFAISSATAGHEGGPIIYVTGQGLFYDSIALQDLPPEGPFQLLEMGGPSPDGLQTEFGPGDGGYVGGRWKLMLPSGAYKYFACPCRDQEERIRNET